jgi:hypothetical protein
LRTESTLGSFIVSLPTILVMSPEWSFQRRSHDRRKLPPSRVCAQAHGLARMQNRKHPRKPAAVPSPYESLSAQQQSKVDKHYLSALDCC